HNQCGVRAREFAEDSCARASALYELEARDSPKTRGLWFIAAAATSATGASSRHQFNGKRYAPFLGTRLVLTINHKSGMQTTQTRTHRHKKDKKKRKEG